VRRPSSCVSASATADDKVEQVFRRLVRSSDADSAQEEQADPEASRDE